ncbi:hypothetical protein TcasGA2_TC013208 [Tribolium castaneum]|uniref:Uncharacterized protein n=1 Tax=Tribolium castaneum TaxID=7070 RepID=D6WMW3_TRICA|nr:hypothetical protein TcasGA2_TC013208 [Tribolium castaneum]
MASIQRVRTNRRPDRRHSFVEFFAMRIFSKNKGGPDRRCVSLVVEWRGAPVGTEARHPEIATHYIGAIPNSLLEFGHRRCKSGHQRRINKAGKNGKPLRTLAVEDEDEDNR